MQFVTFFLGTPRRFFLSLCSLGLVLAYFRPDVIETSLSNFLTAAINAVGPLAPPLLVLLLVILGYKIMFSSFTKKKD